MSFWDRDLGRGYTPRLLAILLYPLIFCFVGSCIIHQEKVGGAWYYSKEPSPEQERQWIDRDRGMRAAREPNAAPS